MPLARRDLFRGAAGVLAFPRLLADVDPAWRPRELDVREVFVEGDVSRRFVLGVPRHLSPQERVPLLVLLHGLGETGDERTGAWAWFERYGLGTSYDRLRSIGSFRGLVVACPYMPRAPAGSPVALDAYARWIASTVVPRARSEAPVLDGAAATYVGGCSLGGYVSLEVMLRRPDAFGAWAGVQSAFGQAAAERYAERLAALKSPPALLIETSDRDPFRAANEALARALTRGAVANTFVELPGPHDQRWLRESGTARMLSWCERL